MGLPVAFAGAAVSKAKRILKKPSPRFFGGPLFGTVNSFMARVAGGDVGVLSELDRLRKTDKSKSAWQEVWTRLVPRQPLTQAQINTLRTLDPSLPISTVPTGPAPAYTVTPSDIPEAATTSITETVIAPLREGLAESVQLVAAGAGTAAARAVEGGESESGRLVLPTDVKTLRNVAIGAAGVVVLVVLIVSFRR